MKNEQNQTILAGKVPAGYQQTEVGIIPEDWEVKKLSDISNFINGRAYSLQEWEKSGIPVIRLQNLTGRGEEYYYSNLILPEKQYCYYGDLLFMWSATFGPIIWKGEKAIYHYHIWKVECDKKQDTKHLYYLLSDMTEKLKRDSSNGGTMLHITKKEMESIFVPIPPLKEQTAIAEALSDVDSLLVSLEKLIEKKRAIKTGTMQQLLTGKKRLPAFAQREDGTPKGYKMTELGEIPEDWEVVKLGDICNYQNGRSQEHLFNNEDGYFVISIGNYSTKGKYIENNTYISTDYYPEITRFILDKNDLAMILNDKTSTGTILGRVLHIDSDNKYVINQRTMRLVPANKDLSIYLYHLINSEDIHLRFINMAKPGTQIYVNTEDVLGFEIAIPQNIDEMIQISNILSDMDAEIEALEAKCAKTEEIKQGMMQELLTGRTRLV